MAEGENNKEKEPFEYDRLKVGRNHLNGIEEEYGVKPGQTLMGVIIEKRANALKEIREEYGAKPGQSLEGAIIEKRASAWEETQSTLCSEMARDIKGGKPQKSAYEEMLKNAGLHPDSRLSCAPVDVNAQELGKISPRSAPDHSATGADIHARR